MLTADRPVNLRPVHYLVVFRGNSRYDDDDYDGGFLLAHSVK